MKCTFQVAAALRTLQLIGIIHGYIKPEDIMLVDNVMNVKIIDFGLARHDSVTIPRLGIPSLAGSIWYK